MLVCMFTGRGLFPHSCDTLFHNFSSHPLQYHKGIPTDFVFELFKLIRQLPCDYKGIPTDFVFELFKLIHQLHCDYCS